MPLLNSLIAMQLEKIKTIHHLVQRLNSDPTLRYNCGFDVLKHAPSESTFSRFLDKLSNSTELEDEFKALVLKAKNIGLIDGTVVAIDSTKLNAFEKAKPKSKIVDDGVSPNWERKSILMVMI